MKNIIGLSQTIAWYDANAELYAASTFGKSDAAMLDAFAKLIPVGSAVLDAGCGSGRDTQLLQDRGLDATGLDLSEGLLAVAKESFPNVKFVRGSILSLPFANESFAGIWAHASLVHLETVADVALTLAEFNRVLRSDGVLYVFVKQQLGAQKSSVVEDTEWGQQRFFQWFTKPELDGLLTNAGFQVLEIEDNIPSSSGRAGVRWIRAWARKPSVK